MHQVFSKSNKGASTAARATSSSAARAQGQLWCGTAAQPWLSLLGKQPCEKAPCGKPCWECLHSAQELLPCTGADPDPNPDPTHSLHILTGRFSARHWPLWELTPATGTRPALLFGLGYQPCPAATHSSCCIPRGTDPSHLLTQGQRVTSNPGNSIFYAFTHKNTFRLSSPILKFRSAELNELQLKEQTGNSSFFLIIVQLELLHILFLYFSIFMPFKAI